jgi:hypothetical protein
MKQALLKKIHLLPNHLPSSLAWEQCKLTQNTENHMMSEDLVGVINLDEPTKIIHPTSGELIGSLTLRYVILNYMKMHDGHPIIS